MPDELTKSDAIKFLSDTNTRVLTYHNHKEVSAWAAVAFYYVFGSAMLAVIDKKIGCQAVLVVWTLLITSITMGYIRIQLLLRAYMGNLTIALPRICFQIFQMTVEEYKAISWQLLPIPTARHSFSIGHSLPQFILNEYNQVAAVKNQPRWWLELLPYLLVGMLFTSLVLLICFSGIRHCPFPTLCIGG